MRIGIDAGGTFTDFVVLGGDGTLETFKLRSNRADPAAVIVEGILRAVGTAAPAKVEVIHGSTVATNALLERKGALTAFVTTAGFEDLLHIGRQSRAALYDLTPPLRRPLTQREVCFGVPERVHADGSIARRPGAAALRKLAAALRAAKVEAVAICLLHAYQTPDNEALVAAALGSGGWFLSVSSEVCPEFREYERASTTAVNAYVGPLMQRYLLALEERSPYPVSILQSNGGLMSAREAGRHAVRTVLSGPAGGVVGLFEVARRSGFDKVMGFDMGGTSTDVSLCDGVPRETVEAAIDGMPLRVPMLDIHTVGAGGGSIARVDPGGLLRVGPESAGSDPGPACYGSGELPTVTDAHVVLGRISADQLVGGAMHLVPARAEAAIDRLAGALSMNRIQAAAGVIQVANANMERAIRAVSIERGYDPRHFALVAFGGCGGLHACEIAEQLEIGTVLVPEAAGVLSALGMLLAPHTRDYATGVLGRADWAARFAELAAIARKESPGARIERSADLRYAGQSYELTVPWQGKGTAAAFHQAHQRTYGYSNPNRPIEIVTLRVRAIKAVKPVELKRAKVIRGAPPAARRVFTSGRFRKLPLYRREAIPTNRRLAGPALILDYGATTLIAPGWSVRIDRVGTLVLQR